MFLIKISQKAKTMNSLVRFVSEMQRRAFISVDKDQRLRRAAVSASHPDRLTPEPGDLCYFWRDAMGWSRGMATAVCQVGQGHYFFDCGGRIFEHSAEQLSHVTERECLAQEAVREIPGPPSRHGSCDWQTRIASTAIPIVRT